MTNTSEAAPLLQQNEGSSGGGHGFSRGSKLSNNLETFTNIFKGNIGAGILGMPYAFMQAGLWGALVGMPIVCLVSLHCSELLIQCKRFLQKRDTQYYNTNSSKEKHKDHDEWKDMNAIVNYSYGEIGNQCFGKVGTWLVDGFLMFTQTGFGCAYVIFTSENMNLMVPQIRKQLWALVFLPLLWVLCCLRSYKYLAPFSTLANFAMLFGYGVVYSYTLAPPLHALDTVKGFDPLSFPIFFGMAVYCYEGIGLVIPIESSMKTPSKFVKILYAAVFVYSILLVSFGFFGYLYYGHAVQSIVTSNLPDDPLTIAVRSTMCFALLMSFPVQLLPVIDIIEDKLWFSKMKSHSAIPLGSDSQQPLNLDPRLTNEKFAQYSGFRFEMKRNLLRVSLATLATGIAIIIPHFGLFLGLIGSMGSSFLAFILPCIFHLKLFGWKTLPWPIVAKDIVVILFGFVGGVLGTIITVKDLVNSI